MCMFKGSFWALCVWAHIEAASAGGAVAAFAARDDDTGVDFWGGGRTVKLLRDGWVWVPFCKLACGVGEGAQSGITPRTRGCWVSWGKAVGDRRIWLAHSHLEVPLRYLEEMLDWQLDM